MLRMGKTRDKKKGVSELSWRGVPFDSGVLHLSSSAFMLACLECNLTLNPTGSVELGISESRFSGVDPTESDYSTPETTVLTWSEWIWGKWTLYSFTDTVGRSDKYSRKTKVSLLFCCRKNSKSCL